MNQLKRRSLFAAGTGLAAGAVAGWTPTASAGASSAGLSGRDEAGAAEPYLVGRGIADATGEVAEVGMNGYGSIEQQAEGLHLRLRSRAFVIADRTSDSRVLLIVADSGMIFESVHQRVLRRLTELYGDHYTEQNVLITATHAGPGGYSHHLLYNLTTLGFHEKTFEAITGGMIESVRRAHADLAPAALRLTHRELHNASVNRSKVAFDNNPEQDKAFFPDALDPQTTVLRIERGTRTVGAINWFATHTTSMTLQNRLISSDSKGYAGYHWEREVEGVDYLANGGASGEAPAFVAAFAQTNAGDMSPNVELKPAEELPATQFESTREIGLRQYRAAAQQLADRGQKIAGGVDARLTYVDMANVTVRPEFTGDGKEHHTCKPAFGASASAGSTEDGGGFPTFNEGENPLWDTVSHSVLYTASPELKECQSPKGIFSPIGEMNRVYPWVQERVPIQLVRVGRLYLIGIPGEVTIVAGLRLRRTVAGIVGADIADVLVVGYTNAYFHYVTTPEEYDTQQFEGGITLFGRWMLPALQQIAAELATRMRDNQPAEIGTVPPDLSGSQLTLQPDNGPDSPPPSGNFGDVLTQPAASYARGRQVQVVFAGAHPNNDLHQHGTYLDVQRWDGTRWRRVADDGDWSTKFRWARDGLTGSKVTITWDLPAEVMPGTYRIRYHGDARDATGRISAFTGTSRTFTVTA